jgi:hypothetical protein
MGVTLFDKIEIDCGRSVRRPIRISVRRGEYPPRFRSTRCMMLARCSANRASTSLYSVAPQGEISVCIPLSLLQMGRICCSEREQGHRQAEDWARHIDPFRDFILERDIIWKCDIASSGPLPEF